MNVSKTGCFRENPKMCRNRDFWKILKKLSKNNMFLDKNAGIFSTTWYFQDFPKILGKSSKNKWFLDKNEKMFSKTRHFRVLAHELSKTELSSARLILIFLWYKT